MDEQSFGSIIFLILSFSNVKSKALGTIYLSITWIMMIFLITNPFIVKQSIQENEQFAQVLGIISLLYSPFLIILMTVGTFTLKNKGILMEEKYLEWISIIIFQIIGFLIRHADLLAFPLKLAFFGFQMIDKDLGVQNSEHPLFAKIMIYILLITDFYVYIMIIFAKQLLLTPSLPEEGFFAKLPGFSDKMSILLQIIAFFIQNQIDHSEANDFNGGFIIVLIIAKLLVLILIPILFLFDLSYFSRQTECQILFWQIFLFAINLNSAISRSFGEGFKKTMIILPVLIIFIKYLMIYLYTSDKIEPNKTNIRLIKKLMVQGSENQNSVNFKLGLFSLHTKGCIKLTCKCHQLFKKYSEIGDKLVEEKQKFLDYQSSFNYDISTSLEKDVIEIAQQKIEQKMDEFLIDQYLTKLNSDNFLSNYIKLLWMIKNKIIISNLIQLVDNLDKKSTILQKVSIIQLKAKIGVKTRGYYFYDDIFFEKNPGIYKNYEGQIETSTKKGINFEYAFFYKKQCEILMQLIEASIDLNMKFLEEMSTKNVNLSHIQKICIQTQDLSLKIDIMYTKFHRKTRQSDCFHMAPYYHYIFRKRNLFRTAQLVYIEYKERIGKTIEIQKDQNTCSTEINFLSNSIILLVDSNRNTLGEINDVYGDITYLNLKYEDIKGKSMDLLILPEYQKKHRAIVEKFLNEPITNQIGDNVRNIFVRVPFTDFVVPAVLSIKMIPFESYNYQFIVSLRFEVYNQGLFFIVGETGEYVEAFSYTMKNLFEDPTNYLYRGIKVKDMNKKLAKNALDIIKSEKVDQHRDQKKSPVKRKRKRIFSTFVQSYTIAGNPLMGRNKKTILGKIKFQNKDNKKNVSSNFLAYINTAELQGIDQKMIVVTLQPYLDNDKQVKNISGATKTINSFSEIPGNDNINSKSNLKQIIHTDAIIEDDLEDLMSTNTVQRIKIQEQTDNQNAQKNTINFDLNELMQLGEDGGQKDRLNSANYDSNQFNLLESPTLKQNFISSLNNFVSQNNPENVKRLQSKRLTRNIKEDPKVQVEKQNGKRREAVLPDQLQSNIDQIAFKKDEILEQSVQQQNLGGLLLGISAAKNFSQQSLIRTIQSQNSMVNYFFKSQVSRDQFPNISILDSN